MSKRNRQRNKPTLERANTIGMAAGQPGAQSVQIPMSLLTQIIQNQAPQKGQSVEYAPGSPLQPYAGILSKFGPRQFNVPIGYNLNTVDRTLGNKDIPNFQQLRTLAMMYSGITLCERVILDMIPKLTPTVTLRTGLAENSYTSEKKQWMKHLEKPSPGQNLDCHSWLRMAWTEQTQIDALGVFIHKTRGGDLFGLEIIDGTTLKPTLDERGMVPVPPYPAYQQYPYGVPGMWLRADQLLYYRESPRAYSPYGFSRVERIILEVNQALRKKQKDLARFTEGNVPAGIMEVPPDSTWSPEQIDAYEQAWNALLAGNAQQQVRVKFTQPGMKYTAFADYAQAEHMTEFDQFLLNVSVGAYGLSLGDLGFTEDIHKSSGDSQQNMMYRRTLHPLVSVYARMLTSIYSSIYGTDALVVNFAGFEEAEDLLTQANAYSQFATVGAISPAGIANLMKFPKVPETGPLLITKSGITPLSSFEIGSDLRTAQDAAQLAGLQQAANPEQQQDEEEDDDNEQSTSQSTQAGTRDAQGSGRGSSKAATGQTRARVPEPGDEDTGLHAQSAISAEYRRWRDRAIADVKKGRVQRGFTTTLIPIPIHAYISDELERCTNVEEVKDVFALVRAGDPPFFAPAVVGGGNQDANRNAWKPKW